MSTSLQEEEVKISVSCLDIQHIGQKIKISEWGNDYTDLEVRAIGTIAAIQIHDVPARRGYTNKANDLYRSSIRNCHIYLVGLQNPIKLTGTSRYSISILPS